MSSHIFLLPEKFDYSVKADELKVYTVDLAFANRLGFISRKIRVAYCMSFGIAPPGERGLLLFG